MVRRRAEAAKSAALTGPALTTAISPPSNGKHPILSIADNEEASGKTDHRVDGQVVRGPAPCVALSVHRHAVHPEVRRCEDPVYAAAPQSRRPIVGKGFPFFAEAMLSCLPRVCEHAAGVKLLDGLGADTGVEITGQNRWEGGSCESSADSACAHQPSSNRQVVEVCIDDQKMRIRQAVSEGSHDHDPRVDAPPGSGAWCAWGL